MPEETLDNALDRMRHVADQVHCCPSCHSKNIYTAVNVAYVLDHRNLNVGALRIVSLAEQGWHGCFNCNHQWISNPMLKSSCESQIPAAMPDNVIDLEKARARRA